MKTSPEIAAAFEKHERLLWGLAYRMTGSAAEADDVVQDTFERAARHPPPRVDEPLRPWLVKVAMNVAKDALRRRKLKGYVGPWLPSPLPDAAPDDAPAPDARYELRESASYAFLVALEALTPPQRAVLLLRDVLEYSVRETALALSLSEINVKVIHHRARRAMEAYERPAGAEPTGAALGRLFAAILSGDAAAAEACIAEDARLLSDGGGEYRAALRPVYGAERIVRFFLGLQKKLGEGARYSIVTMNGLPAIVGEYDAPRPGWGPRFVIRCDVGVGGRIRDVHEVVASGKLTALTQ